MTPYLGFKVMVFLQVEYLNNGATLKMCKKMGVVIENFVQEVWKFFIRMIGWSRWRQDKAMAVAELPIRYEKPLLLSLL